MQHRHSRTGFERAAKSRQSDFRNQSPTISADARRPMDQKGQRNPHLLSLGWEEENLFPGIRGPGGAIEFFSERKIRWWKSSRSGDDAKVDGPTRNMASSQVACVNFLLPLAGVPGALTAALRVLDEDVSAVVDVHHDGSSSPVEFEWLGVPHSLEGGSTRGAQNTSVDALLVAETTAGQRRAYLIEWKYVERYLTTRPDFKGAGKSGCTRRGRYADLFHSPFSAFNATAADFDAFLYEPFYQIMRQRLLADRMVQCRELEVDEARVVVVVPEENWAYRALRDGRAKTSPALVCQFSELETVEDVMRATLKEPDSEFGMVPPSLLFQRVVSNFPDETAEWANYWRERYGL